MVHAKKQNLLFLVSAAVFILIMFIAFLVFSPQTGGKLRVPQGQEVQAELSCSFTDDNIVCTKEKCTHEINYVVENNGKASLEHASIRIVAGSREQRFDLKNISSGEKVKGQITVESSTDTNYLFYDMSASNASIADCDGFVKRTVCPNLCLEKGPCYLSACSQDTDYVCSYEPKSDCCGNGICEEGETYALCESDCEPPECGECETLAGGVCVTDFEKCPEKEPRKLTDFETQLVDYAKEIGLDADRFKTCMEFDEKKEVVEEQIYDGFERYWITHTPTFVLAGNIKVVGDSTTQKMADLINQVLNQEIDTKSFKATEKYMVMAQPSAFDPDQIQIQEFFDFKCPYSKQAQSTIKELESLFGEKVRFAFKNFPLDTDCNQFIERQKHPGACSAAYAAECARDQGKFREFKEKVFEEQEDSFSFAIG